QPVQRRRTIEHNGMPVNDVLQNFPYHLIAAVDDFFSRFNRLHIAALDEAPDNEGLVQLNGHLFRQATLMELQLRAYNNHRTAGIVNTLTQQILTEATALAFQHVAEGFQ